MMSTMNQLPRSSVISSSILRFGVVCLLAAAIAAQSRIIKPPAQTNSNSGKRSHIATVRSSDSSEGSRVAISSDQSLNNYEAYRRGDRFYVKIPAADVPRAESVRGRGFADVKAQRSGDSTVVSFRLQPGATAHVEQRANRLDVVVSVPGGGNPSVASNRTREATRPNPSESSRKTEPNKRGNAAVASNKSGRDSNKSGTNANKNSANSNKNNNGSRTGSSPSGLNNSNSNKSNSNASTTTSQAKGTPTPNPTPSPKPSPTAKSATPSPTPKSALTNATTPVAAPQTSTPKSQGDFWSRLKERAHYWILLAQLNPIPVALGAGVLLLIIGLLLFQRRRARATRRERPAKRKKEPAEVAAANETESNLVSDAAPVVAAATVAEPEVLSELPPVVPIVAPPVSSAVDHERKERVGRVSEEAKKVFEGEQYDESIIGSNDSETRRLVGAELSSALVGRNAERRERARDAFMKHGYFDDATRDLRVSESENERAAAARRLSFVNDHEATPHLIGALGDPAPDVRRAAVEALMDLRDPAAIGPLNSLLQAESDRKVPRNLIQNAIEACATSSATEVSPPAPDYSAASIPHTAQPIETEREVIEL